MRWSIRTQFVVPLLLLLAGLGGVCSWTALESARRAQDRISGQVVGIVHTLSDARFPLNQHVLEQMKGLSGADYLLLEPDGHRVATISAGVNENELPPTLPLTENSNSMMGTRVVVAGTPFLARGVLLRPPHLNSGSRLYILYPESLRDEAVWQAVRPILILGVSAGVAALILTLIGARQIVRRLRELDRRTRLIAGGDFSPMPLPRGNDELRDLAQSVNEMADKLARFQEAIAISERDRLLGQVSAGLAHQLRNAVTGAKLAVQLHIQSCSDGDRESLEVAERQLTRMAADLRRFFDLGQAGLRRQRCSLTELIDESVALLRPQSDHAHTELRWVTPPAPVFVVGDAGQLGHMILNVIGNAIEAAGPGGRVEVVLATESSRCVLEVSDTGPGPSAEIAARLFEPFVTGKPEGVGLGLAVSKQVAEAHGGSIKWTRVEGHTRFRIELPLADEQDRLNQDTNANGTAANDRKTSIDHR
jgi:signal transduction histidine kinase